MTEKWKTEQWR